MKLVLGSSSKWRQQVLRDAGYDFTIMSPDIDEKAIRHNDPNTLVLALANAKADALLQRLNEPSLIIASDQVTVCDGEIREKPNSPEQAREFLRSYSQYPATRITGVVVVNTESGQRSQIVDRATVYFDTIPENIIEQLIMNGDVFTCSGGFSATDPLLQPFVSRIEGTVDSLLGLPMKPTQELIARLKESNNISVQKSTSVK